MKKGTIQPRDSARPFDVSEIFFSTTDRKGIISACNEIFIRVSGYEPAEMLAKPHNIIRHPDMPRCVFKLLWDYLLSDRPIGAYVKNLANTGEYYWVYALAAPADDGFLSVRIKPTSAYMPHVEKLYSELLAKENEFGSNWKAGMAASTELLLARLKELGFASYDDFMCQTLHSELKSRKDQLTQNLNGAAEISLGLSHETSSDFSQARINESLKELSRVFSNLANLMTLRQQLHSEEVVLTGLQKELSLVALNAGTRATHLADAGRALGVVSTEISNVSKQISAEGSALSLSLPRLSSAIQVTSFNVSLATLQCECIQYFLSEQSRVSLSHDQQISRFGKDFAELTKLLFVTSEASILRAAAGIGELSQALHGFREISESLAKILLTIQFSYITGKALAATVPQGESFAILLQTLSTMAESERARLNDINETIERVADLIDTWNLQA